MMSRLMCTLLSAAVPVALLAACSDGAPQSCTVATAASLPLLSGARIPTVQAGLAGRKVAMLIDTGSFMSMIAPSAAERFDLNGGEDPRYVPIVGVGGITTAPIVEVHHLELGYGRAHDLDLPVGTNLHGEVQGLPLLGLLGADFLANYDVDIDVPHHHFAMYQAHGCENAQPFDGPYFEVPFHLDRTEILVDLKINGIPLTAQLDSGASSTTLTQNDAERIGVTADLLKQDHIRGHTIGVDSDKVAVVMHQFGSLEIGDERMNNFRFAVAPIEADHTLLGDDFLHFNRVWISYARQRLFIQPAFDNRMVQLEPSAAPTPAGH